MSRSADGEDPRREDRAPVRNPTAAHAGSAQVADAVPLLRTVDLCKVYVSGQERVHALAGMNLTIERPGFIGIMGPSGSGKSTLLHLLAGLDRPTRGEIIVDGQSIDSMSERELTAYRRRRIGIVFQQFNLLGTMTAIENVMLPGVLDGRDEAWLRRRAVTLLESLGLSARMTHRPDALSGGEQQRVAIARALLFEPRILFADEPTGSLDSATSRRIWEMLASLAHEHGLGIVMVTHEPAAAAHCDRVCILGDGRITEVIDVGDHDPAWLANRSQQSVGG